jgi:hypothetical protein
VRTDPRGVPGTPAYLAPELYAGQPATERTDQFSFCVSLYEALYGQRPFAGQTVSELRTAVQHGTPRPPPAHAEVPRWLLQIVLRGLSREPAARFRSMDELLAALAAGSPVRRRLRLVVPAALVAALLGVGLHGLRQSALVRCLAAGRTTGLEQTADPALRSYGAAWSAAWRQSCLSAHLWRTNTGAAAESQAACLELARAEAQARAALRLSLPDRDPGPDMPLRELRRCGRPATGVRGWPAPGPAGEALRTLLAKAQAQQALGEARLAWASAEQALVLAERHHLGAAAAEALLLRGAARCLLGEAAAGAADFKEALWTAQAAQHETAAAAALVALVESSVSLGGAPLTLGLASYARGAIERMGGDRALESRLASPRPCPSARPAARAPRGPL